MENTYKMELEKAGFNVIKITLNKEDYYDYYIYEIVDKSGVKHYINDDMLDQLGVGKVVSMIENGAIFDHELITWFGIPFIIYE